MAFAHRIKDPFENRVKARAPPQENAVNGAPSLLAGIPAALKLLEDPDSLLPTALGLEGPAKTPPQPPTGWSPPAGQVPCWAPTTPEAAGVSPHFTDGENPGSSTNQRTCEGKDCPWERGLGKPRELLQ